MNYQNVNIRLLWLLGFIFLVNSSIGLAKSSSPADSSFLGVCSQLTRETKAYNPYSVRNELMNSIKAANIHFTRTGFKWSIIHPTQAEWDWRVSDEVVAVAKENGINILALITGMPPWVAESPEKHVDLWIEFVDSLTHRYKQDIFYWEIWNEPNMRSGKYWPQAAMPDLFASYVIEAGKIIRHNQPDATILLGGLTTAKNGNAFGVWNSLFALGVLDVVDGIAYHTYNYTGVELIDFNRQLAELVSKYTQEHKEYWITEYGVPAVDSNKYPKFSYAAQSKSIMKSILVHWATGGSKFFIFALWDKEAFRLDPDEKQTRQSKQGYYGLLTKDMQAKPSYGKVKWLSALLDEYEPIELQIKTDGVLIVVRNKKSGKHAFFSWGSKVHQELLKDRTDNMLSSFESGETQLKLDQVKSKTLNQYGDDVLFWR